MMLFYKKTIHLSIITTLLLTITQFANAASICTSDSIPEGNTNLDEIVITASRISRTSDGVIINLKNNELTKGKSAIELFNYLPGLNVRDSEISINGNKPSGIFIDGIEIKDYKELEAIRGSQISKVQIKYIGSDNRMSHQSGGEIHISLIRPIEKGIMGNVSGNLDIFRNQMLGNESISGVAYGKIGNWSFYNYIAFGGLQHKETLLQEYDNLSGNISTIRQRTHKRDLSFTDRLSISYEFNSRSILKASYLIGWLRSRPNKIAYYDDASDILHDLQRNLAQQVTLKYSYSFTSGTNFEATFDYYNSHFKQSQTFYPNNLAKYSLEEDNKYDLWKGAIDFNGQIAAWINWAAGASFRGISNSNNQKQDKNGLDADDNQSNKGFIPVVYFSLTGNAWKLKYRAGCSWQMNYLTHRDINADSENKNIARQFNPYASVTLPFGKDKSHNITLSYTHSLATIPYSALSTIKRWEDAYNYTTGNPYLKAPVSNTISLNLSLWDSMLNIFGSFTKEDNSFTWITFADDDNPEILYTKPINIDNPAQIRAGAQFNYKPLRFWNLSLYGVLTILKENSLISGIKYDKNRLSSYFSLNNSFDLGKNWGASVDAAYEPTQTLYDRTYKWVYNVQCRVWKSFCNGRWQISAHARILDRRRQLIRTTPEMTIRESYITPQHDFGISAVWTFSAGQRVSPKVTGGAQNFEDVKDSRL